MPPPPAQPGLDLTWLAGPTNGAVLDVGLVSVSPGGATPPHAHNGGQVIVVVSGRGFVDGAEGRVVVGPGDVVIADPGELHTHGAEGTEPLSHITVTTGGVRLPE